jgi:hypothetical protein
VFFQSIDKSQDFPGCFLVLELDSVFGKHSDRSRFTRNVMGIEDIFDCLQIGGLGDNLVVVFADVYVISTCFKSNV